MKTALPLSVRSLVERIEGERELDAMRARDLLRDAEISEDDLAAWSDFDHPPAHSYGRKLVWDGGFFELRVGSWIDGDMTAIHDHGRSEWGAVRLYGRAEHAVFKVEDAVMTTGDRRSLPRGVVVAVDRDLVHQLGNVGQEPFLTLHLLGGQDRRAGSRLYELDESAVLHTGGGVFFDPPRSEVDRREEGPDADFPTWVRHQAELLKRLMTRDGVLERGSFQSERPRRLAGELFAASTWFRFAEEWDAMSMGPSLRFEHYTRVLGRELKALAELQMRLFEAGLAQPVFDVVHLRELLAFSSLDTFVDGYLDMVSDAYSLGLASLAAA